MLARYRILGHWLFLTVLWGCYSIVAVEKYVVSLIVISSQIMCLLALCMSHLIAFGILKFHCAISMCGFYFYYLAWDFLWLMNLMIPTFHQIQENFSHFPSSVRHMLDIFIPPYFPYFHFSISLSLFVAWVVWSCWLVRTNRVHIFQLHFQ